MNNTVNENNLKPWESYDDDLEDHAVVATQEQTDAIDEALGLQMISIRLQRSLLSNLKHIADYHNVGYQPLIRDLLNRFARSEILNILDDIKIKKEEFEKRESTVKDVAPMQPIDNFFAREGLQKQA